MNFLIAGLVILFTVCLIAAPIFFIIGIIDVFRRNGKAKQRFKRGGLVLLSGIFLMVLSVIVDEPSNTTEVASDSNETEVVEETEEDKEETVDEAAVEKGEEPEETEVEASEESDKIIRDMEIRDIITERAEENYDGFEIDNIRINENLGDEESDTYIVLVDLLWTRSNREDTANEMIKVTSQDVAANLHNKGADDVAEVAVFTHDEYNDNQHKHSFEWTEQGFAITDTMIH